jgi:PAS domain S-box-containing protein
LYSSPRFFSNFNDLNQYDLQTELVSKKSNFSFLQGGGEMGERTRNFDWSTTPVGQPDQWPQSLRTIVSVILNSRFPMFLWWGPDLIQFYNDAYRPSLGNEGKHPAALGQRGEKCWPEIWPVIKPLIDQVLAGGEATWSEDQLIPIYRNGKLEDVYWTFGYSPVNNESGNAGGVLVVCNETTEKVKQYQQAKKSEQQIRTLIESAPFPIGVYTGREMKIQFANQTILDVWGKGNDVIGKLYRDILPELENQEIFQQLDEVYKTGVPFHAKNRRVDIFVDNKIQPYYFNYSFTPLFDSEGKVYGVMNTGADVTDLNLAWKKLEESESRFRDLVQNAPVAIAVFEGRDLIAKIANDDYLPLAGKSREEFIGRPLFESLPEAKAILEPIILNIFETGEPFYANEFSLRLNRFGKEDLTYFNFAYEPLREPDGTINGFMVVAQEVTEQVIARKKIEESEAELQRRVEERTVELANTNEELKRSNQNLQEFAYAASHDMKEPIRKIHFFGDRLKGLFAGKMNEEEHRYFDRMQTAAKRMGTLIDDLLLYSHISRGAVVQEGIDLNGLISLVLEDLELEAEEKGATITVDPLPKVKGHKRQLQQLFQNLIGNALKYTRPGIPPAITITSSIVQDMQHSSVHPNDANKFFLIEVKDNGIGFEQANAERIFNVFTRLHGNAEYRGTGVGLSIARKVVENHHGRIEAVSHPGEGSIFRIYLPC